MESAKTSPSAIVTGRQRGKSNIAVDGRLRKKHAKPALGTRIAAALTAR
jgi:hypothetical protein